MWSGSGRRGTLGVMSNVRHGVDAGRAGGYGDARGLAGYRYVCAVLALAAVTSGATLALMVGAVHHLGYLPETGRAAAPPSVASPFTTYAPQPAPSADRPVPASADWSMLPG